MGHPGGACIPYRRRGVAVRSARRVLQLDALHQIRVSQRGRAQSWHARPRYHVTVLPKGGVVAYTWLPHQCHAVARKEP
jgi:hypothetical protein